MIAHLDRLYEQSLPQGQPSQRTRHTKALHTYLAQLESDASSTDAPRTLTSLLKTQVLLAPLTNGSAGEVRRALGRLRSLQAGGDPKLIASRMGLSLDTLPDQIQVLMSSTSDSPEMRIKLVRNLTAPKCKK